MKNLTINQEGPYVVWRIGKRPVFKLEVGINVMLTPNEITTLIQDVLKTAEEAEEGDQNEN